MYNLNLYNSVFLLRTRSTIGFSKWPTALSPILCPNASATTSFQEAPSPASSTAGLRASLSCLQASATAGPFRSDPRLPTVAVALATLSVLVSAM